MSGNVGSWGGAAVGSNDDGRSGPNGAMLSLSQMSLVDTESSKFMARGLCRDVDEDQKDLWYLDAPHGNYNAETLWAEAKKICRNCPVQGECLTYALENREPWGVWGGQGPMERADLLLSAGLDPNEIRVGDQSVASIGVEHVQTAVARAMACKRGHPRTPENTRYVKRMDGGKEYTRQQCIVCEAERRRMETARLASKRAVQKAEKAEEMRAVISKLTADRLAAEKAVRDAKAAAREAKAIEAAERRERVRLADKKRMKLNRARKAQQCNKVLQPEWAELLREVGELSDDARIREGVDGWVRASEMNT